MKLLEITGTQTLKINNFNLDNIGTLYVKDNEEISIDNLNVKNSQISNNFLILVQNVLLFTMKNSLLDQNRVENTV